MAGPFYLDPAVGNDGNAGTSWGVGNAWATLQKAADTAVAGEIVYCRGTETLSAAVDFNTNAGSSAVGFIKFIGCKLSDGSVTGVDRFVLDGNSGAVANCIASTVAQVMIWFENFELHDASGAGQYSAAESHDWVWINCYSHDHGAEGWSCHHGNDAKFLRCIAYNNGTDGWGGRLESGTVFAYCKSYGNTDAGWYCYSAAGYAYRIWVGCISHANTENGLEAFGNGDLILNSVIDENVNHGILGGSTDMLSLVLGCRITGNGTVAGDWYGLDSNVGMTLYGWNFFLNNDILFNGNLTAIPYNADADTNETSGTEGYTDGDTDDFNLTAAATLRSISIELD